MSTAPLVEASTHAHGMSPSYHLLLVLFWIIKIENKWFLKNQFKKTKCNTLIETKDTTSLHSLNNCSANAVSTVCSHVSFDHLERENKNKITIKYKIIIIKMHKEKEKGVGIEWWSSFLLFFFFFLRDILGVETCWEKTLLLYLSFYLYDDDIIIDFFYIKYYSLYLKRLTQSGDLKDSESSTNC